MGEEERKEGEERERWKEIFEGGGHERKRRRGEERRQIRKGRSEDRMVREGDTVMREGGKDRTAIRKGREGKLNRRKEIWE